MYRIANWNIERPRANTRKTRLVLDKIYSLNADILVLTESSNAVNLVGYNSVLSTSFIRNPDENWVVIWSKWEIIEQIETLDKKRTACALINAPFGSIIIYGTIIPYHMAGVSGKRYEKEGYKAWQYHEEDIGAQSNDWQEIIRNYPNIPFFVVGDFNQTRDGMPGGYGTEFCRDLLTKELEGNNLKCVTEIDLSATKQLTEDPLKNKVRRNIDHIVASKSLLEKLKSYQIGAWNHFTEDGIYMSDHNGVYLDFEISE